MQDNLSNVTQTKSSSGVTKATTPKPIRYAAVFGSGIMGSQIAAHLAGCGIRVLLLDIPSEGKNRNAISQKGLDGLRKIKPSPLYTSNVLNLIQVGNTEDDLEAAGKCDWVIEAIIEQTKPKLELFAKLNKVAGPDTIISTNTSGIPLKILAQNFSSSQSERFIGTHFFNPPRYLRLVELIAGPKTSDETIARMRHTIEVVLGKTAVSALDSPAFIANRIGVQAMVLTLQIADEMGLSVEEVDALTGPLLGRPKTGTFKLADLVGLDTLVHIIHNLAESFPTEKFPVHSVLQKLIDAKQLGRKTGAGFYKKVKEGFESIDLKSGEYKPSGKARFEELKSVIKEENIAKKLKALFAAKGRGADAAKAILAGSIAYALKVGPSVAKDFVAVDTAMELGFGWEMGPAKMLDALGVTEFKKVVEARKLDVPNWVWSENESSSEIYLRTTSGEQRIRTIDGNSRNAYKAPGIQIKDLRASSSPLLHNADASVWDIQDGVLLLEFHSKMNSQGPLSLEMIVRAIEKAAKGYNGLVIGNQGTNFCAGANIAMVLIDASNGEYDNVDAAVKAFQAASMAIKYSPVPVVVSPHGMALGGGCEFVLHSNRPVLSPETYIGLVEVGVGLLPAGGGCKELTIRAMDANKPGIALNRIAKAFELIAMGKVATSAQEAIESGLLDARAVIASNEQTRLEQAKDEVLALARAGYRPPAPGTTEVLGTEALAALETGVYLMREAGWASEHDQIISGSVARVLAGGAVTSGTRVTEEYLLDLEREEFMRLVGMKKTQERIEYMLKNGKPLRN